MTQNRQISPEPYLDLSKRKRPWISVFYRRPQLLLIFLMFGVFACQSPKGEEIKDAAKGAFSESMEVGDFQAASMWAYQLIHLEPDDRMWKDSLLNLLFIRRVWPVCEKIAEDLLEKDPKDQRVLGILANTSKAQNKTTEAITHFETLCNLSDRPIYRYELAGLQYELKRIEECKKNLELLLENPAIGQQNIELRYQRGSQNVSLKAACLNMMGVLEKDFGKSEQAKEWFQQALAIDPEFSLAKGNLESLK